MGVNLQWMGDISRRTKGRAEARATSPVAVMSTWRLPEKYCSSAIDNMILSDDDVGNGQV